VSHYLLDSDVLIWCLRGRKDVLQLVRELHKESLPGCSSMSIIEVQLGVKKGEEEATHTFLDALRDYPVEGPIAHQAAEYIREWQKKSKTLDFVDAIIAATCTTHQLILVTYNLSHFPMSDIRL